MVGHPDLVTPFDTDSNSMETGQMCIAMLLSWARIWPQRLPPYALVAFH